MQAVSTCGEMSPYQNIVISIANLSIQNKNPLQK